MARQVLSVTERDGKTYWSRVGVAFENNDGSVNVILDAFPVSGKLQIRDFEEKDTPPPNPAGSRGPRQAKIKNTDDIPF